MGTDGQLAAAVGSLVVAPQLPVIDAGIDSLTSLPNRDSVIATLKRWVELLTEGELQDIALIFIDFDNFKILNDSRGHDYGDELFRQFAERLRHAVKPRVFVGRLQGDEFVVLIPNISSKQWAFNVAWALCSDVSGPYRLSRNSHELKLSAGVAWTNSRSLTDHMQLLWEADRAMFLAKHRRSQDLDVLDQVAQQSRYCRVMMFNQAAWDERLAEHEHLDQLLQAVASGDYHVTYQPVVDLAAGQVVGAEALVRPFGDSWHDDLSREIALLENEGLLGPLWRRVAQEACQLLQRLPADFWVSVNISGYQLMNSDLAAYLKGLVTDTGIQPHQLVLELTERQDFDHEVAHFMLDELLQLGFGLVLDDYGTHHSTLGRLINFPEIGGIKLDRTLVNACADNPRALVFLRHLVAACHESNTKLIAEGIETTEQAQMLRAAGCKLAQGYLWGRPMLADQFAASLA